MTKITLKGNSINTVSNLPTVGDIAPNFNLIKADLTPITLDQLKGSRIVLNIFPSLDTEVCAASVRRFNADAANMKNTKVLCVSKDLPFAHGRFCSTNGLNNVITASDFKNGNFGKDYGVTIVDGPLAELHSRAVVIIDENGKVIYNEQVPEITQEPNYEKALNALK